MSNFTLRSIPSTYLKTSVSCSGERGSNSWLFLPETIVLRFSIPLECSYPSARYSTKHTIHNDSFDPLECLIVQPTDQCSVAASLSTFSNGGRYKRHPFLMLVVVIPSFQKSTQKPGYSHHLVAV